MAYTSHVQIGFGDEGPVAPSPSPGEGSDATDATLRELRRRVVDPVVRGLLADDELTSLSVHWGRDGTPGDTWVRLTARGEVFEGYLTAPDWGLDVTSDQTGGPLALDLEAVARRLASNLEDWIAESGFGWGQQRQARYTLDVSAGTADHPRLSTGLPLVPLSTDVPQALVGRVVGHQRGGRRWSRWRQRTRWGDTARTSRRGT